MKVKRLAVIGLVGWLYSKGPRDPREWVAFLGEQAAVLKEQGKEALAAGKEAAARREEQLDREIAASMGRTTLKVEEPETGPR